MAAYVGPRNCRSFSIDGITNMNAGFELWCDGCTFLSCPKRTSGLLARLQDGFPLCHLKSVFAQERRLVTFLYPILNL